MKYIFAIGDIHGMGDALDSILKSISQAVVDQGIDDYQILFTGDYIDRGPDSARVVQQLITLDKNHPGRFIFLRGNHEQMLLDAMSGRYDDVSLFRMNGGTQTLHSYDVKYEREIPQVHLEFYRSTKMYHRWGDKHYFVHAGINPYKKLHEQTETEQLWIREPFLEFKGNFPEDVYVIHGHTPRSYDPNPTKSGNRLNLDFGAVFGGQLVCALFREDTTEAVGFIRYDTKERLMKPQNNPDMD